MYIAISGKTSRLVEFSAAAAIAAAAINFNSLCGRSKKEIPTGSMLYNRDGNKGRSTKHAH